jgi:hypothetical protein
MMNKINYVLCSLRTNPAARPFGPVMTARIQLNMHMGSTMASLNEENSRPAPPDAGDTILDELLRLQETGQLNEIQLLNYYKEVPVSATAKHIRFLENTLFCRTSEAQARAIEFTLHTIVKSKDLQHHIHASAHYNTDTREVALSGFSYVEDPSERRESIRVRMHIPISVLIESGRKQFKGRLIDLSLDGCAIDIANRELQDSKVCSYLNIDTSLKTNQEIIKVRVMGKLLKADEHNKLSRCIYIFMHDKGSEGPIGKLIALRQGEIIRELQ